jgi:hypothetical protein
LASEPDRLQTRLCGEKKKKKKKKTEQEMIKEDQQQDFKKTFTKTKGGGGGSLAHTDTPLQSKVYNEDCNFCCGGSVVNITQKEVAISLDKGGASAYYVGMKDGRLDEDRARRPGRKT